MDNICFIISIRQRICQSGVPINIDNTYTNITNNTSITLSNGYTVTVSRASNNTIRLTFANPSFDLLFFFDIDNSTTNVFDLPIDGGTFRIAIFAAMRCCDNVTCCNSSCCCNSREV